ncbi:hypothetical protein BGW80DRAFT_1445867 [Lactifluus volemus]|nr:hypothetical protein BGW80DRAFT_1445867 [Lactifluus volemus]
MNLTELIKRCDKKNDSIMLLDFDFGIGSVRLAPPASMRQIPRTASVNKTLSGKTTEFMYPQSGVARKLVTPLSPSSSESDSLTSELSGVLLIDGPSRREGGRNIEILLEIFEFCRAAAMKLELPYWVPQPWPGGWPGTWRKLLHISIWLTCLRCEKLATIIQEPLPALTSIDLERVYGYGDENYEQCRRFRYVPRRIRSTPTITHFVGCSISDATSTSFVLQRPFRTLPSQNIYSGYISPEALATGLSALTRLTYLCIEFDGTFLPRQAIQHPPLLTRTVTAVLPTLKKFHFEGVSEYLEDLLAQIDVPQLEDFRIVFFRQHDFDIRQVISHSQALGSFNPRSGQNAQARNPRCHDEGLGWQVSSITQMGTQFSCLLSSIAELDILSNISLDVNEIFIVNTEWLELFHPFSAVRTLYLSGGVGSHVVSSLQELTGERIAEVLPNLQNLYFRQGNEFEQLPIDLFFAPSDHPVTLQSA